MSISFAIARHRGAYDLLAVAARASIFREGKTSFISEPAVPRAAEGIWSDEL
jgi:hypothetical protein